MSNIVSITIKVILNFQNTKIPQPTLPVTRESAPAASNIYAEVERVPAAPAIPEPEVDPAVSRGVPWGVPLVGSRGGRAL